VAPSNTVSAIRQKFALLLAFSDYRHQWVDYSTATTPAQHLLNGKKYRQPRRASAAGKV
jgi:hypothetical protein